MAPKFTKKHIWTLKLVIHQIIEKKSLSTFELYIPFKIPLKNMYFLSDLQKWTFFIVIF